MLPCCSVPDFRELRRLGMAAQQRHQRRDADGMAEQPIETQDLPDETLPSPVPSESLAGSAGDRPG